MTKQNNIGIAEKIGSPFLVMGSLSVDNGFVASVVATAAIDVTVNATWGKLMLPLYTNLQIGSDTYANYLSRKVCVWCHLAS